MYESDDDEVPILFDVDTNLSRSRSGSPSPQGHLDLSPVPVTILTGFLGSGKTTLLKNILTSKQHNRRIAVIENEFGGGDSSMMQSLTGDNSSASLSVETMIARDGTDGSSLSDFIELPNGCVCCTVKDSLVSTLEKLLEKRADLDYIIVECSGMADPGPVASVFWLDEALESRLRLDGVVGVVDVVNILGQLDNTSSLRNGVKVEGNGDEAARQIAFADRIIINKIDLVPRYKNNDDTLVVQRVIDVIKSINPTAPTLLTTFSSMDDLSWVLDTQCFNPDKVKEIENSCDNVMMGGQCMDLKCRCSQQICGFCSDTPQPTAQLVTQHQHTSAISTIALFNTGSVDLHKLNIWLASILWPNQDEEDRVLKARLECADDISNTEATSHHLNGNGQNIYRIKGVISVAHTNITDDCNDKESEKYIDPKTRLDRRRYIVQAVNDIWDVTPASDGLCWAEEDTKCCKIVVIGKFLVENALRVAFEDCFI